MSNESVRFDRDRRLAYLAGMGVDVWERRSESSTIIVPGLAPANESGPTPGRMPGQLEAVGTAVSTLDWAALEARVSGCRLCSLHASRQQCAVFGSGTHQASVLVLRGAPDAGDDQQGEPFSGLAGKLLDNMLRALGFSRKTVYITTVVKAYPPAGREPQPEEVLSCMPYLQRQIALLRPSVILALGQVSASSLLCVDQPLDTLRAGHHYVGETQNIPVVVSYDPAYLLKRPAEKAKAWQDLKTVRSLLERQP